MAAAVDRISELPECILHHILSFLSQKQAVQTSTLSKSWRHVGPTRPKLEFRQHSSEHSYEKKVFISILRTTVGRYEDRNLCLQEFVLEMTSRQKSIIDKVISMVANNASLNKFELHIPGYVVDASVVLRAEYLTELCLRECNVSSLAATDVRGGGRRLKALSLVNVKVEDATLETIIRGCPLIERVTITRKLRTDPVGGTVIPSLFFRAEFLTELHLFGCTLNYAEDGGDDNKVMLLKRLSLESVRLGQLENMETIMRRCPLIESVLLYHCAGLKSVLLDDSHNKNIKHFSCSFSQLEARDSSIVIDVPTVETVRIANCRKWYSYNEYCFPRLKSLYLHRVRLSAELRFSSNFPCLEKLDLNHCEGFKEINLALCSIKRLVIVMGLKRAIKTTINAPNIDYFEFSGHFPPQLIFETETGREWKSHVVISFYNLSENNVLQWLLLLSEMLNALRQSRISLVVSARPFMNLKVEDTNDGRFYKPVAVESLNFKGEQYSGPSSSYSDLFNCLFLICRPRYIGRDFYSIRAGKENINLAEFIIFKIKLNQRNIRKMSRDLEEIRTQVWDNKFREWHPMRDITSYSELKNLENGNHRLMFRLKWRDSL